MLDIDGESHNVLIKEVDYNPLKGRVDEMDFRLLSKMKLYTLLQRSYL